MLSNSYLQWHITWRSLGPLHRLHKKSCHLPGGFAGVRPIWGLAVNFTRAGIFLAALNHVELGANAIRAFPTPANLQKGPMSKSCKLRKARFTLLPWSHEADSDLWMSMGHLALDPLHLEPKLHSVSSLQTLSTVNSHSSLQQGPSLGLQKGIFKYIWK